MAKFYEDISEGRTRIWATGIKDKISIWWEFKGVDKSYFIAEYEGGEVRSGYIIKSKDLFARPSSNTDS